MAARFSTPGTPGGSVDTSDYMSSTHILLLGFESRNSKAIDSKRRLPRQDRALDTVDTIFEVVMGATWAHLSGVNP